MNIYFCPTTNSTKAMIYACLAALLAGFVDAIVGGGGLIQAPAMFILFPSFSVPRIIGTNRFASFMGTAVAAWQYSRKVAIPWRTVLYGGIGAGAMSFLGARFSSLVSSEVLKPIILVLMVAIAVYTYFKKDLGHQEQFRVSVQLIPVYGLLVGMSCGFYNGFVGPGTGSLLVFGFVSLIGYNFHSPFFQMAFPVNKGIDFMFIHKIIQLLICPVVPVLCIGDGSDFTNSFILVPHLPANFTMKLTNAIRKFCKPESSK
jgi:uncharacterized membrane protein YfcA